MEVFTMKNEMQKLVNMNEEMKEMLFKMVTGDMMMELLDADPEVLKMIKMVNDYMNQSNAVMLELGETLDNINNKLDRLLLK
jgi:hypothetical protein